MICSYQWTTTRLPFWADWINGAKFYDVSCLLSVQILHHGTKKQATHKQKFIQ